MPDQEENNDLTPAQKLQIIRYVNTLLESWLTKIGIGSIAALAAALVYIFFFVPDMATNKALETITGALNNEMITIMKTLAKTESQISQITERLEAIKDATPEQFDRAARLVTHIRNNQQETDFIVETSRSIEKLKAFANSQNVRTIVTKTKADEYCQEEEPASKAAHVPWAYIAKSGNAICAKNNREEKTCIKALRVTITNDNTVGRYQKDDLDCRKELAHPWPWGEQYWSPNTLAGEWHHGDTFVVCCKQ